MLMLSSRSLREDVGRTFGKLSSTSVTGGLALAVGISAGKRGSEVGVGLAATAAGAALSLGLGATFLGDGILAGGMALLGRKVAGGGGEGGRAVGTISMLVMRAR